MAPVSHKLQEVAWTKRSSHTTFKHVDSNLIVNIFSSEDSVTARKLASPAYRQIILTIHNINDFEFG